MPFGNAWHPGTAAAAAAGILDREKRQEKAGKSIDARD